MFIQVRVRPAILLHGYDAEQREISETLSEGEYQDKLLRLDRLQSATERYLLVNCGFGRQMLWEYQDGLTILQERLRQIGQCA